MTAISATEIRYVPRVGPPVITSVTSVSRSSLSNVLPVREPPSHLGQRHYPGRFWCSTTQDHVFYESRLELSRLLLADFDPHVSWVAAQPMWITGTYDGKQRRHVPDFLLTHGDGSLTLVDVKAPYFAQQERAKVVFRWTAEVCKHLNVGYEVWQGADATLMANLRLLAVARRQTRRFQHLELVDELSDASPLGVKEEHLAAEGVEAPRNLIFELLWHGRWSTDLSQPLQPTSTVRGAAV